MAGTTTCGDLTGITTDPPELPPERVARAVDYVQTHPVKLATRTEVQVCEATFYHQPPPPGKAVPVGSTPFAEWRVDVKTGRQLVRDASGRLLEVETPCLQGFDRGEYKCYDPEGAYVCSVFRGRGHIPDPKLPDPFQQGGGLTFAGFNVDDINRLLSGAGGSPDLSGLVRLVAALVLTGQKIGTSVDGLPGGLGESLAPSFLNLGGSLDALPVGFRAVLADAVKAQDDHAGGRIERSNAFLLGAVPQAIPPAFQSLVDAVANTLPHLAERYRGFVNDWITTVLNRFRAEVESQAPVGPHNVDKVAASALRVAMEAGLTAQLGGFALELLQPLKNLGIQQALGLIAEIAGFAGIVRPLMEATLRYGIGLPAEHRAAAHFRSALPPVELVRLFAARGLVPLERVHERAILAGFPDPYPAAVAASIYEAISPRALSAFTDGSEADRAWLGRKLRYFGLSPEDTDKGVRALELKATQPGRAAVVSQLLAAYEKGHLPRAELVTGLDGAGLSPTHRDYYVRAAELRRRAAHMEDIATEALNQYRNDQVGVHEVTQLLGALGFTEDEVVTRITVADLRRGVKQVRVEELQIEAEIRAVKAKALANALLQLRAGLLGLPEFLAGGQGMGYSPALLRNAAELALLQGPPRTTAEAPAIGLGALHEAQTRIAALVTREVEAKRTNRLAALGALARLGLPSDLGAILVDLAEAIAGPEPFAGDFGLPAGAKLGGVFGEVATQVGGGLGKIRNPAELVREILAALHLPGRTRDAVARLIHDLRELFRV